MDVWAGAVAGPACSGRWILIGRFQVIGGLHRGPASLRRWSIGFVGPQWTFPTARNRAWAGAAGWPMVS